MRLAGLLFVAISFGGSAALACAVAGEPAHSCCRNSAPQPSGGCHGGRCVTTGASVAIPAASGNDARPALLAAATESAAMAPHDAGQAVVPTLEHRPADLYLSLRQLRI